MTTDINVLGVEEAEAKHHEAWRRLNETDPDDRKANAAAWQEVKEAGKILAAAQAAADPKKYGTKQERKEAIREEWAEIRSAAQDVLKADMGVLEAFKDRLTGVFLAMRDSLVEDGKEPFKRRPHASLRLIARGEPLAKVIALPHVRYDATGGYLVPTHHTIELLELRIRKAGKGGEGEDVAQFPKKLNFADDGPRAFRLGSIYKSAPDDVRRVVETIREFMDDARAVLARGCDHCCICGRGLTDELSRSRGIGPECIQKVDLIAVLLGDGKLAETFVTPELVEA
jgi:hypothetical protein